MKGGSIIPMWPEGTLSWRTRDRSPLDLDIYPTQAGSFTLYEDDGVSRGYARGEYAEQAFTVRPRRPASRWGSAPASEATPARSTAAATGSWSTTWAHDAVMVGDTVLPRYDDKAAYAAAGTGWYRDPARAGTTDIKLPPLAAGASVTVRLPADQTAIRASGT